MGEEISKECISRLLNWVESSTVLLKKEWPEFVQQFLNAHLINHCFSIIFLVLVLCSVTYFSYRIMYITDDQANNSSFLDTSRFMAPFGFILAFAALVGVFCEMNSLVNLLVNPKYYIVSHLKDLFK